mgnify:CR=1 FL=1
MLCPSCQNELTQMSLTGGLLRVSCPDCQIYFLEVVDASATTQDLLNILHQVVRKEPHA